MVSQRMQVSERSVHAAGPLAAKCVSLQPEARTMQSEIRLALTLTLSPRRGESAMAVLEKSRNVEHSPALENLLRLPWGEGEREFPTESIRLKASFRFIVQCASKC